MTKVFIRGFSDASQGVSRADIEGILSPFGEVTDVVIPRDYKTGRCRGYAFAGMDDEGAAAAILQSELIRFRGRVLTITRALRPRERFTRGPLD